MGKSIQNDIPLEAVLKYIKRERDKYKTKLETLITYTKSLEQKLQLSDAAIKKRDSAIATRDVEIEGLRCECKALRNDVKNSAMWQNSITEYKKTKEKLRDYQRVNNKLLVENRALKKQLELETNG